MRSQLVEEEEGEVGAGPAASSELRLRIGDALDSTFEILLCTAPKRNYVYMVLLFCCLFYDKKNQLVSSC